jgi:hypothetical protein
MISATNTADRCATRMAVIAVSLAAAAALAGCSGSSAPEADGKATAEDLNAARAQPSGKPAAGPLTAFRLTRAPRSQADVARAGAALAGVLHGKAFPVTERQAAVAAAGADTAALDVAVGSTGLQFSYRADNDRRLVIDEAVTSNMATTDIGNDAARKRFMSAFGSAVSSGVVVATGLNPDDARGSRIVQGEGMSGQAPVERISEYIFTVPRVINGIEVFDAGFELSVHRTGQLARVQMFGPSVASTVGSTGAEVPDASSYSFSRVVSQADLESRVAAEHPGSEIHPIGVRYWLPPDVTDAVVEPTQMYFVVSTAKIEGQDIKARGSYIAYSLKNAGQAATVWPRVELHPSGDGHK